MVLVIYFLVFIKQLKLMTYIFFSFYKATEAHDLRLQHAFACH